jgi:hypothetical protein
MSAEMRMFDRFLHFIVVHPLVFIGLCVLAAVLLSSWRSRRQR